MTKLLSLELFLVAFISIVIFFLGYSFRTMVLKRKSISILDGGYPTTKEERKIKDFVSNIEKRLNFLEKNKTTLEEKINENKHRQQIKEELFLKKIENIESRINVSIDESGRIPELEQVALSIDRKINKTIYDEEGLRKVRKIKDLELELELIDKEANESIEYIKRQIKELNKSINMY